MTTVVAILAVALVLAFEPDPEPRVTFVEGRVTADPSGVRTAGGRAEVRLPDGALLHLDAGTRVRYARTGLALDDGRVALRLRDTAIHVALPAAGLQVQPDAVLTLLVDGARSRVLVSMAYGDAVLTTRAGHVTPIAGGQSVMLTGPSAVPWAAAYAGPELDRFAIWSDMRIASAGAEAGVADDSATGPSSPSTRPPSR